MTTDLESQLQRLGRALDEQAVPVGAGEIFSLSRPDSTRTAVTVDQQADLAVDRERIGGSESHRRFLLGAAASVLVLGLVAAILLLGRTGPADGPVISAVDSVAEPVSTPPPTQGPASSTVSAPPPRLIDATVIPLDTDVQRPDVYPVGPRTDEADSFGSYAIPVDGEPSVVGLVGRLDGERLSDGVRIETLPVPAATIFADSGLIPDEWSIDGVDVDVYGAAGDPTSVVLPGTPTILVTGPGAIALLERTGLELASASWTSGVGRLDIDDSQLPEGYAVIVEPEPVGADFVSAYTSIGLEGSDGPSVEVQLNNPLPIQATYEDLVRTDVADSSGWSFPTIGGHGLIWQVSPTTWASVRARGAADETLTLEESVALAEALHFVDEATWRGEYRVPEPSFGEIGSEIAIDAGFGDGIEVGMLVQVAGASIGRVSDVLESTSRVTLRSNPDFVVASMVLSEGSGESRDDCRVRGGSDHLGFVCDEPFGDDVAAGAAVVASGTDRWIPQGTSFGTITSITQIGEETVALLTPLDELTTAGDSVVVVDAGA